MIARLAYTASQTTNFPAPDRQQNLQCRPQDGLPDTLTHDSVMARNTGWRQDAARWAASRERSESLERQTEHLAALLEQAGVPTRQESSVVAISAVTGIVSDVAAWRPIRFLPAVAARDRRPMLSALQYWVERVHPQPRRQYLRYGVVTHGALVPAHGDLRGALQRLARTVSKWAHEAREMYGVEVHFRGSEFTRKTASERGLDAAQYPDNDVLYHPHANVLVEPTRVLPADGAGSWSEFLAWTHGYFGAHWRDNGRIKNIQELVKYVVKPGDLLDGEHPLDAAEAKWLHETLFRLNLAQPMGKFREYYKGLSDRREKISLVRGKNDKPVLRVVSKSRRLDHKHRPSDAVPSGGVPENTILGTTLPQWRHTPWAEPAVLVQGYQPRAYGRASRERLLEIEWERNIARQAWDANGAPDPVTALQVARAWREKGGRDVVEPFRGRGVEAAPADCYMVHTSSLTVQADGAGRGVDPPPEPPPDRPERSGAVFEVDFRGENERSEGSDRGDAPASGRHRCVAA